MHSLFFIDSWGGFSSFSFQPSSTTDQLHRWDARNQASRSQTGCRRDRWTESTNYRLSVTANTIQQLCVTSLIWSFKDIVIANKFCLKEKQKQWLCNDCDWDIDLDLDFPHTFSAETRVLKNTCNLVCLIFRKIPLVSSFGPEAV